MSEQRQGNVSPLANVDLCFYGAGSMAEAIVRGLTATGAASPERMTVLNRQNAARLAELRQLYGVRPAATDAEKRQALAGAGVIVLCMKPKDAAEALLGLKSFLREDQLIVSVIAGLSIETIQLLLGRPQPVVRTMPNTSSTIGLGATGLSFSETVAAEGRALALAMFDAVGMTTVVEERLMETVTAVSGSGPAYIYYMMEAMIAAGVAQGLSPEAAHALTVQTVRGAAEMVRQTGESPADLRRKVTSPNGTTQAAIETMDRLGFVETVGRALDRCAARAAEMGQAIAEDSLSRK
ncbi:pyrroline-5-carboxylate reductase [Cohnella massiliensis]|uniref:pyrroline-5-carboxylate reductase n=1 Tax=Cohnella massiliensis TaxID=1816691 RepID=UPI0009BA8F52|nr:pyrroline-5-carboxylate reductase [Cohnella massiliensis]